MGLRSVGYSEGSATFYQNTWCHIPEDSNLQVHQRENLECELHLNIFSQLSSRAPIRTRLCPRILCPINPRLKQRGT
jgi:hypothetical protein